MNLVINLLQIVCNHNSAYILDEILLELSLHLDTLRKLRQQIVTIFVLTMISFWSASESKPGLVCNTPTAITEAPEQEPETCNEGDRNLKLLESGAACHLLFHCQFIYQLFNWNGLYLTPTVLAKSTRCEFTTRFKEGKKYFIRGLRVEHAKRNILLRFPMRLCGIDPPHNLRWAGETALLQRRGVVSH